MTAIRLPSHVIGQRPAPGQPAKRRLGLRALLLALLVVTLLAMTPGIARFGGADEPAEHPYWRPDGAAMGERAEENFPGSAFYFLDPADLAQTAAAVGVAQPVLDAGLGALDPSLPGPVDVPGVGPAALPFVLRAGTAEYGRALKCLTDAIYYEGATEPDVGQRAIAQVILNRMRHASYPHSVCGVIYQGSERATGCQFSYSCDGSMARIPSRQWWLRAQRVAAAALSGSVYAPAGLATHYHTSDIYPYWAPSLNFIGTIGAHRFYRWKGKAGTPAAFFARYAGIEPFPGPKPRAFTPASALPAADPIQLQKQFERDYQAGLLKAQAEAMKAGASGTTGYAAAPGALTPAPSYAAPVYSAQARAAGGEKAYGGERLPDNGNVKAEYADSGTWKGDPQ